MSSVTTRYQITLTVLDEPGVLAAIATLFSDRGVSVEGVAQSVGANSTATLVIITHEASESALAATVEALATTTVVSAVTSVLRVEGL